MSEFKSLKAGGKPNMADTHSPAHGGDPYFTHNGPPTGADKPSNELHGADSRQEFIDRYRREMDEVGRALDKPVQNRLAAADRHARGGGRRGR